MTEGTAPAAVKPASAVLPALAAAAAGLLAGVLAGYLSFDRSKDIQRLTAEVQQARVDGDLRLAAAKADFEKLLASSREEGRKELDAVRKEAAAGVAEARKQAAEAEARLARLADEIGKLTASRGSGRVALFDGKDMARWQPVGGPLENWAVEQGLLVCTGGKGARWISTREQYGDFDLSLDYRVGVGGNSGVFIRVPHHDGDPAYTGMEVQVLDNRAEVYKNLKPWQFTGSLYHAVAPAKDATRPAGEWNHLRVRCQGAIVQVYVNGERIVDADMDGVHDPNDKKNDLRHRPRRGFIGLQNHGNRLEYRNILLVALD